MSKQNDDPLKRQLHGGINDKTINKTAFAEVNYDKYACDNAVNIASGQCRLNSSVMRLLCYVELSVDRQVVYTVSTIPTTSLKVKVKAKAKIKGIALIQHHKPHNVTAAALCVKDRSGEQPRSQSKPAPTDFDLPFKCL